MSLTCFVVTLLVVAAAVTSTPIDAPMTGYNASHAVARGIVERATDYYCVHHCYELCHEGPWCCGVDDCHYGSHRCACYNVCYCGGSGLTYRCNYCDL